MSGSGPQVLVLGATGMLGHRLVQVLGETHDVHATARNPARAAQLELPAQLHEFDVGGWEHLPALLEAAAPDVAINAIGLVKQLEAGRRPIPAIEVNALFPHRLAEACAGAGVRLVHVSTDCVFSGRLPAPDRYTEEHAADPEDIYGRSKLLGEPAAPSLTIRTSIIGWELERASGLLEWFAAQEGEEVRGFTNALFSGLTTTALARVLDAVVTEHAGLQGLFHVASEPISKFDLLERLRTVLAVECDLVPVDEPRINRALDGSRFHASTGIEVPSWETMLAEYGKRDVDAIP